MNKVIIDDTERHRVFRAAEAFDREINEWGMECYKRLLESRLLVIGLNGVGSEVVKNLCLSGLKSITIMDDTKVSESDRSANFFCSAAELGKMRSEASLSAIKALNPSLRIHLETGDPSSKQEAFYKNFELVFATGLPLNVYGTIDKICRDNKVQFYCADTWGYYGYGFLDLNEYKYRRCISGHLFERAETIINHPYNGQSIIEQDIDYFPFTETLQAKVGDGLEQCVNKVFVLLHILNNFHEMHLKFPQPESRESDIQQLIKIRNTVYENLGIDPENGKITDEILSCVFGELSPTCSAVGGIMANEIIKGVTRMGLPVHNYFLFDGDECVGVNELIYKSAEIEVFKRLFI